MVSCVDCIDWSIETATEEKHYSQYPLSHIVILLSIFIDTVSETDVGEGRGTLLPNKTKGVGNEELRN